MDLHVDDLAPFVFVQNPPGRRFSLCLEGIESGKDLFFFVLDLFCKGLVLLYGQGGRAVDLTSLDAGMFARAAGCMACGGITVRLASEPEEGSGAEVPPRAGLSPSDVLGAHINVTQLASMPDNAALEDYVFRIRVGPVIHCISFLLRH